MAHKDIQIQFQVKGRCYEAVGFLNDGWWGVDGYYMLKHTDGNGGAITEEDRNFLNEHRDLMPSEGELRKYDKLMTGACHPQSDGLIYFFSLYGNKWFSPELWLDLDESFCANVLVLRRRRDLEGKKT